MQIWCGARLEEERIADKNGRFPVCMTHNAFTNDHLIVLKLRAMWLHVERVALQEIV